MNKGSRRKARKAVIHWSKLPPQQQELVIKHRWAIKNVPDYKKACIEQGVAM